MYISVYVFMCIYVCRSYYYKLVGGLRTQFFTLLEVWGGRELACWLAVLDTKMSPYDGDRVLQVVMGWNIITYHIHTSTRIFE